MGDMAEGCNGGTAGFLTILVQLVALAAPSASGRHTSDRRPCNTLPCQPCMVGHTLGGWASHWFTASLILLSLIITVFLYFISLL